MAEENLCQEFQAPLARWDNLDHLEREEHPVAGDLKEDVDHLDHLEVLGLLADRDCLEGRETRECQEKLEGLEGSTRKTTLEKYVHRYSEIGCLS